MSISNRQISILCVLRGGGGGGGGVRPIILENSILRYGLKRNFFRVFWVLVHNVAQARPRRKMGPKTKIITQGDRSLKLSSFDLSRKNKQVFITMSKSDEK